MSYELSSNSEYIHLKYSGVIKLEERQKAKDDVINLCFEKNINHALVDLRNSDIKMNESDSIRFASSFESIDLPKDYRLAVIMSIENSSDNIIEAVISMKGISIKYFFEFDTAVDWLVAI